MLHGNLRVKVNALEEVVRRVEVTVEPIDFLDSLKVSVCGVPEDAYINEAGEIVTTEDVSYHGSPTYVDKKYEISDKDREILEEILKLKRLLRDKLLSS